MRKMSELTARTKLLQLMTLVEETNNLLHDFENSEQCCHLTCDVLGSVRQRVANLRHALGYTRQGPLMMPEEVVEMPLPTIEPIIPAPKGWGMIEGGHETPALLQPQAM